MDKCAAKLSACKPSSSAPLASLATLWANVLQSSLSVSRPPPHPWFPLPLSGLIFLINIRPSWSLYFPIFTNTLCLRTKYFSVFPEEIWTMINTYCEYFEILLGGRRRKRRWRNPCILFFCLIDSLDEHRISGSKIIFSTDQILKFYFYFNFLRLPHLSTVFT